MQHICTLIAPRASRALTPQVRAMARQAVGQPVHERALSDDTAYALSFDLNAGENAGSIVSALRTALGDVPIDVIVLPAHHQRKNLLIADMDSTMIEQECIDELAEEMGIGPRIALITERAMRGEIAFEPALRERVALLEGLSEAVIDKVFEERIRLTCGGKTLIATMKKNGAYAALVSGGFTHFTAKVAAALGFDEHSANRLIVEGGKLTGSVEEPILGRDAKAERLRSILSFKGLNADSVIAVGDGANDLAMIEMAGLGVAFHAKPALEEKAQAIVRHGDLTALLYLQGYGDADFVES